MAPIAKSGLSSENRRL